jgi:hypothetical protein
MKPEGDCQAEKVPKECQFFDVLPKIQFHTSKA